MNNLEIDDAHDYDNESLQVVVLSPYAPGSTTKKSVAMPSSISYVSSGPVNGFVFTLLVMITMISLYQYHYSNNRGPTILATAGNGQYVGTVSGHTINETDCNCSNKNDIMMANVLFKDGITNSTCAHLLYNDPRSLSCYHDMVTSHGIRHVKASTQAQIDRMESIRPNIPGRRLWTNGLNWTQFPNLGPLQLAVQMAEEDQLPELLANQRVDLTIIDNYREAFRIKRLQECIDIWLTHGNWTNKKVHHCISQW
jgi:hypothetical protein